MLEVVIALVIMALIALFIRAGRQNTIVYRKRVARPDEDYSIKEHPSVFSPDANSGYYSDSERGASHEALAFQGGEFGGAGAGDSYDLSPADSAGNELNNFDAVGADFNNSAAQENELSSSDSASDDSGSSDSGSDSSNDCSGSCDD